MRKLIAVLVVAATGSARAGDEPWSRGVPARSQSQANELFAEGNQLFAQQAHGPALEKYKAAIALWDHPLIRFNMAVTQIRLDRILEAADDLEAALRFGPAPFTAELYQQALDYQRLVSGRVGWVEASCAQRGVQILLDGKPWFACPATRRLRVLAGEHVLVGEKQDFATQSKRLVVVGGATVDAKIQLASFESAVKHEYPSPRWLPFTVAGGGAAIALGGLGFWFAGRSQMDTFESEFAVVCPTGCGASLSTTAAERELAGQRDSAELKGTIAVSMLAAGGAILVGGTVWAILNRPKRIVPSMEVAPTEGGMTAQLRVSF